MKRIKIVITGGSGFIGTNLVKDFVNNNIETINLDINKPKDSFYNKYWEKLDLRDFDSLSIILNQFKPSHIVHLAADLGMDHNSFENLQCNIIGIENLIQSIKKVNSIKRVIFTSSLLVCKNGYIPNNDLDYCPPNYYGESKVIGEKKVRGANLQCEWAIVRPTSIWGPWFDYSYRSFFKMIDRNKYLHIGKDEFQKPASYVGNTVYMIKKILFESNSKINKSTYYLADYPWYSTKKWANTIQQILNSKKISTAPIWLLKLAGIIGDLIKKIFKIDPPLTSFRLKNMLTGGKYPIENTKDIVGKLPYNLNESVFLTAEWMYKNKIITHKPRKS
tara:strand:- start:1685 stop:2683 length:999 start_codon:yes stop_codon:yes gene_type:complete